MASWIDHKHPRSSWGEGTKPDTTKMSFIEKLEFILSNLEEDSPTRMFLDGGVYSVWRPREHGPRLTYIHSEDFIKEPGDVSYEGSQSWGELLYTRNNQLTCLIVKIASVCEVTQQDGIIQKATSWAWIQEFLGIQATQVQKYNIETEVQTESQEIAVQKSSKQLETQTEDDYSEAGPSTSFESQEDHSYMTRSRKRSLSPTSKRNYCYHSL